jgi:hypothetical protein
MAFAPTGVPEGLASNRNELPFISARIQSQDDDTLGARLHLDMRRICVEEH